MDHKGNARCKHDVLELHKARKTPDPAVQTAEPEYYQAQYRIYGNELNERMPVILFYRFNAAIGTQPECGKKSEHHCDRIIESKDNSYSLPMFEFCLLMYLRHDHSKGFASSPAWQIISWLLIFTLAPAGTDLVIKQLPPMTASFPITVSPPSIEAPE